MTERTGVASFQELGTTVVVVVETADELAAARSIVVREVDALDKACSRFRPDSELRRLRRAKGKAVSISPLLCDALRVALCAAESTGGLVDPTIGKTLRLSGYDRTFALVSRRDARDFRPAYARASRWREIELDPEARTVAVPPDVELDLGATAKALGADRCARAVADETGSAALVSLGGDLAVAGVSPPDGWPIRIADDHAAPLGSDGPVVSISTGGLATSSTRVRRWNTTDGERHHIIDPRTGRAASGSWRTVSVTGASCVDANTASTAAIILGAAAPRWLEQRGHPARLVAEDGSVVCVGGWPVDGQ